jgi:uncharacterized protein with PQ loop repeat
MHGEFNDVSKKCRKPARATSSVPAVALMAIAAICLSGCDALSVHDTASLLIPQLQRSEIVGFLAGFGTTFAAVPDLLAMLRRRSSAGMNPRMVSIMGAFQILWIYYGLLILSRPVIAWNVIGVVINCVTVAAYFWFSQAVRDQNVE